MKKARIGVQLFCVRGECDRDLPATLKTVAGMGYAGAEPWGYRGDSLLWMKHPVADVRRMYDDCGLACCGLHIATDALLGDRFERTVEFNRILGNRFLIIAGDGRRMGTRAGVSELAGILNDAAARLAPHGMFTGYHAHPSDFVRVDVEWLVVEQGERDGLGFDIARRSLANLRSLVS